MGSSHSSMQQGNKAGTTVFFLFLHINIDNNKNQIHLQILTGHTGSVLCLQYDDKVIISGSSDSTVRVWDVKTGEMTNTLIHHCEAVLHLRFNNGMMVTCSKVSSCCVHKQFMTQTFRLLGSIDCCVGYDQSKRNHIATRACWPSCSC